MFSFGNHKLPKTTATFNMTTAKNCPSKKLGMCNAVINGHNYCYANISEKRFKQVLKFRKKQEKWWRECTDKTFIRRLEKASSKPCLYWQEPRPNIDKLRFNESGDFPDQKSVDKAEKIAQFLWAEHRIIAYCHTSRQDLDYSKLIHLKVRGSGFTKPGIWGPTDIITKSSDLKKYKDKYICPGNCRYCNYCTEERGLVLFLLH